jgi:uncharacterized protein GlcG (DUF336 family)
LSFLPERCPKRFWRHRDKTSGLKEFRFYFCRRQRMSITLEQARAVVDGALAKARDLELKPVSVAVLDDRGSLVVAASEDGVSAMRARIAHGKANAAIQLGMGTRALMNRAEQQAYFIQAMNGLAGGDMVPVPGGLLLRNGSGELLGAVGISGDASDNDEAAALGGVEAAGLVAETG